MDSDGELDIVEQAERTALEEAEVENDVPQEVQQEGDEDEAEEVEADGNEDEDITRKIIKPKRVVRNPQPKLNAETLRGPRGLTALPTLFAKQKFKGRGHEETDLNVILKTYEYWCHRLYPKMRFDQCIEKIETLGNKKQVITYVKRIRMGILDEEPAHPQANAALEDEEPSQSTPQQQQQIESVETRFDNFAQQHHQQPAALPPKEVELTKEQMEIIKANKERALKLRAERLQRIREQAEAKLGAVGILPPQSSGSQHANSQDTSGSEFASFNSSDLPIHDKTTQIIADKAAQGSEKQGHAADLDDDEGFSTLCSQVPISWEIATDETTNGNGEEIVVDDFLNNLLHSEEGSSAEAQAATETSTSQAMDVDLHNQPEDMIGVDELLHNLEAGSA